MVIKKSQHIKRWRPFFCVAKMTPSLLRERLTLKMIQRINVVLPEFASFICWTNQHLQTPTENRGVFKSQRPVGWPTHFPMNLGKLRWIFVAWFVKKRWPNDLSRIAPHINQATQSVMFDYLYRLRRKKKKTWNIPLRLALLVPRFTTQNRGFRLPFESAGQPKGAFQHGRSPWVEPPSCLPGAVWRRVTGAVEEGVGKASFAWRVWAMTEQWKNKVFVWDYKVETALKFQLLE